MSAYFRLVIFQYLKSPFTYISFLLPILLLFGLGQLVPSAVIFPLMITTGYVSISLLLFGGTILEVRKKSFIKSLSLTKVTKMKFIAVNVTIAVIFMIVLTMFSLFLVFVLSQVNFLAVDWSGWGEQDFLKLFRGEIDWKNINWIIVFYSIFISVFTSLGMAFFVISFSKTQTSLYLFSFVYLLALWFMTWLVIPSIFPYGKIKENNSFSFLVELRYFLPHYWSTILLSNGIQSQTDIIGSIDISSLPPINVGNLIIFINSSWDSIIEFVNFYNVYYNTHYLWKEVFEYVGTLIFGIVFYMVSLKYFSWSVR